MSDLYTSLQVSPRKKRGPPSDGGSTTTPKRLRTAKPSTPRSTTTTPRTKPPTTPLPDHCTRLLKFHGAIQQALSHALATCAISPSADSGRVLNVLNHISLQTYAGLTTSFGIEDLRRLCWIWEWDGETLPEEPSAAAGISKDDNPFLEEPAAPQAEWTRGSMGFTISLGSHYSKSERKRIPAYGVGIEVEMDIDKDMSGGMAAVARWTAAGESRRAALLKKLEKWVELHAESNPIPATPTTDLPPLPTANKPSALTRTLASASPKSAAASQKFPIAPGSPSRSPTKKPPQKEFAIPFPVLSRSSSPTKLGGTLLFPQTPSKRAALREDTLLSTPRTPASSSSSSSTLVSSSSSATSTPTHQKGANADTAPETPTTSRRQALYERIRARSLSKSPTKHIGGDGTPVSRDQMLKLSQDEMRRRCLLERLPGVAESIWMLFATPASGPTGTPSRKRRTMPVSDVLAVVIKSSPVPISNAEAAESLTMLIQLCPFFVKKIVISGKEWLEMPSNNTTTSSASSATQATPSTPNTPSRSVGKAIGLLALSPTKKGGSASTLETLTGSPKAIRHSQGGLREVREVIRREIELQD